MNNIKDVANRGETKQESIISRLNDEIHNFSYESQNNVEYGIDGGNSNNDNDYGKTIFLNCFVKARANDSYPGYITGECEISNPKVYAIEMLENGYLREADVYETLNVKTVAELKKSLKEQELKQTGNKDDLIARLLEEADLSKTNLLTHKYYITTEKALEYIENHKDYLIFHKTCAWMVDWREYDRQHIPNESLYETIRRIAISKIKKEDVFFGRNEHYLIYQAAKECGYNVEALKALLYVLYIDTSGVKLKQTLNYGFKNKQELINDTNSFMYGMDIAPGIVREVEELKNEYQENFVDEVFAINLPINMCSKEAFKEIMTSIIEGKYIRENGINKLKSEYVNFISRM